MGLPANAAGAAMNMPGITPEQSSSQQLRSEFLEAPWRLQAESYEGFASRLTSLGQELGSGTNVEEELRQLGIDPELFYRQNKRLQSAEFSSDDLDPSAVPAMSSAGFFAQLPSSEQVLGLEGTAEADVLQDQDREFDPPPRGHAKASSAEAVCMLAGLNIPSIEEVEDMPFEEITLTGEGETRGGRLGHATPKDLSARVQFDSLTDDGDEDDDFRKEVLEASPGDEEDAIEAFSLDPEFDYDNETQLTSKVSEPERSALVKQSELPRSQPVEDREDEAAEDAVVEN